MRNGIGLSGISRVVANNIRDIREEKYTCAMITIESFFVDFIQMADTLAHTNMQTACQ